MEKSLYENYKAVLTDLEASRERLQHEIERIDSMLAVIRDKIIHHEAEERALAASLPFSPPVHPISSVPEHLIYAGISVRWAILSLMADHASEPLRSAEIAEALLKGGVRSGGQNFHANVSAVASEMARKKRELALDDGRYQITDHGREVWDGIKHSPQYRFRRIDQAPLSEPAQNQSVN